MNNNDMLTVEQVAEQFQVHARTIQRWIKTGRLPAYRPGREYRIRRTDLEAFLAERAVEH